MLTGAPDWQNAPRWACYAAQDPNGGWWWYECRPIPSPSGGWVVSQHGTRLQRADAAPDWRGSVQMRPGGVWTYREDTQ